MIDFGGSNINVSYGYLIVIKTVYLKALEKKFISYKIGETLFIATEKVYSKMRICKYAKK